MQKIKDLLTKFFPEYDNGTAGFIVAILLSAVMLSCIFASDYFVGGNQDSGEVAFNIGAVLVFLGAAGGTYVFGKTKDRIGK